MKQINKVLVFWIPLCLILVYLINWHEITFDAAMNYDVSKNLSENGMYASSYGQILLFDHNIQTGITVILPTSILNRLFGATPTNMQFITTAYFIAFLFVAWYIVGSNTNYHWASLATVVLLCVPYVAEFSWVGFGELATGVWMLLCIVLLDRYAKNRKIILLFYFGLCFALGYLTKTVFLICVPAFVLYILYDIFKNKGLKKYFVAVAGAAVPVTMFEIYKLSQLGQKDYVEWWKYEFNAILGQAGVISAVYNVPENENKIEKALYHMQEFSSMFRIPLMLFVFLLLLSSILFLTLCLKKEMSVNIFLLYSNSIIYFIWWSFMMPSAKLWPRRIVLGYIFLLLSFFIMLRNFISLDYLEKIGHRKIQLLEGLGSLLFLSIVGLSCLNMKKVYTSILYSKQIVLETQKVANKLNELAEGGTFFGVDWWQNPVLSAETGITFNDLNKTQIIPDGSYFVRDNYMDDDSFNKLVANNYGLNVVYKLGSQVIYALEEDNSQEIINSQNYIRVLGDFSEASFVKIYFDTGQGYSENECQQRKIRNNYNDLIFASPSDSLIRVRLDFISEELSAISNFEISSIEVSNENERKVYTGKACNNMITERSCIKEISLEKSGQMQIETTNNRSFISFLLP